MKNRGAELLKNLEGQLKASNVTLSQLTDEWAAKLQDKAEGGK